MSIIVGLPLREGDAFHIATVAFLPEGTRLAYAKRHLHSGEALFFQPGHGGPLFGVPGQTVAIALCSDNVIESYTREAAQCGADLYATGVLISERSYIKNCEYLQRRAREYKMAVLMANHALPVGGYPGNGMSAFWDASGKQIAKAGSGELLLIARRSANRWQGEIWPLGYTPNSL